MSRPTGCYTSCCHGYHHGRKSPRDRGKGLLYYFWVGRRSPGPSPPLLSVVPFALFHWRYGFTTLTRNSHVNSVLPRCVIITILTRQRNKGLTTVFIEITHSESVGLELLKRWLV